jgi:uncharacterized protein YvpB
VILFYNYSVKRQTIVLIIFLILFAEAAAFCFLYFNQETRVEALVDESVLKTKRVLKAEPVLAKNEGSFSTFSSTTTKELKPEIKIEEPVVNRFVLPIPLYYQQHSLSCEIAALRMALAGVGVKINESDIIEIMPINPAPRIGNIWGDPDKEFVGSIDGAQNTTGYGVHWPVIRDLAQAWRPESEGQSGATYADIVRELKAGHPVIYWGVAKSNMTFDPWQTLEGKTIKAWTGEHVRTIIGYEGDDDNPSYLIINDPTAGRLKLSRRSFLIDWARFDNSLVIVR